ncbi:DNA-binding transcriptional activator MhpR [compost metagenome]
MREVGFMGETSSIAVPVLVNGLAACAIAVTYIASALKPEEVIVRYEPLLRACATSIASLLSSRTNPQQ